MGFWSEKEMTGWPHFGPELEPACAMVKSWIGVHNPYWGILIPPLIPINPLLLESSMMVGLKISP